MLLFLYCFYYSMLHVLRDFWFWQFCNLVLNVKRGLIRNIISVSVLCFRVAVSLFGFRRLMHLLKKSPISWNCVNFSSLFSESFKFKFALERVWTPAYSVTQREADWGKKTQTDRKRQRQRDRDQKPETQREMRNWTGNSKWKLKRHGLPNGP